MEYADILRHLKTGRLVGIVPVVNEYDEPALCYAVSQSPYGSEAHDSTLEERARVAVRVVQQVRRHYRIT